VGELKGRVSIGNPHKSPYVDVRLLAAAGQSERRTCRVRYLKDDTEVSGWSAVVTINVGLLDPSRVNELFPAERT
jgi:hypothetical protein